MARKEEKGTGQVLKKGETESCSPGTEIYVTGWGATSSFTESNMRTLFEEGIGPLRKIDIPRDPRSGKSRGFAFLVYNEPQHAFEAIKKHHNKTKLGGRTLRVSLAPAGKNEERTEKTSNGSESECVKCCCETLCYALLFTSFQ
mmetsp:Transcript_20892/g.39169  ORF Transcript_20892/g.39169 Transcript_20892/m.39169 type:complete len:144 (-) Transcript_20892:111-542(-)